jgi:hypothetical protein
MKNTPLLMALLGAFVFVSCKKDNSTAASGSWPKTMTEDVRSSAINSVVTYNLTYDANHHIVSIAAIPEPSVTKFIYQYTSGNSFTLDLYSYNALDIHEILWRNASSYLDSTFQYNNTNDSSTEKYIYNSQNQLIHVKNYYYYSTGAVPSHTADYIYDNSGNVVTEIDGTGTTTTFTYYTDLPNTLLFDQSFIPQPKYLIKTATRSPGGYAATHYYSFDSNNRLVKDSASTASLGIIAIKTYTY